MIKNRPRKNFVSSPPRNSNRLLLPSSSVPDSLCEEPLPSKVYENQSNHSFKKRSQMSNRNRSFKKSIQGKPATQEQKFNCSCSSSLQAESKDLGKQEYIRQLFYGLETLMPLENGTISSLINLDNAATTPPFKPVMKEIETQLGMYGTIGRGIGPKSEHCTRYLAQGRDKIKQFFGPLDDRYTVFYTNSTTDGMNKLASALITSPDEIVMMTQMEHDANDAPWRNRCDVVYVEVDEYGRLDLYDMWNSLEAYEGRVKIVSVTAVSHVTGYVNDIHEIARMAHEFGAYIVIDGTQITAHREVSLLGELGEDSDIDFFVFSAHKMYSPYGCGAVIGLIDVLSEHLPEFYIGGMTDVVYEDEIFYLPLPDSYEGSVNNYPGIVGMLKAFDVLDFISFPYIQEHEQLLLRQALNGLNAIPEVIVYGDSDDIGDRIGILIFSIEGIGSDYVADRLAADYGIITSNSDFFCPSYVQIIQEMSGYIVAPGVIRISFGIYTTEEEVEYFIKAIREIVAGIAYY